MASPSWYMERSLLRDKYCLTMLSAAPASGSAAVIILAADDDSQGSPGAANAESREEQESLLGPLIRPKEWCMEVCTFQGA